jgi:gamma-glutamylcyclotransferase (GGCT)/AIG2-like uncharacterized protein YtfP
VKRTARTPALFVYGSLMHKKYWRRAVGSEEAAAIRLIPARLKGWRRWWNGVRRGYGGSLLNLKRAPGHVVWGAVVEGLSPEAWERLDAQESTHLPRERVMVVTERGRRMWAHCYRQRVRGPEGTPAADYLAAVRMGANALGSAVARNVEEDVRRLAKVPKRRGKNLP